MRTKIRREATPAPEPPSEKASLHGGAAAGGAALEPENREAPSWGGRSSDTRRTDLRSSRISSTVLDHLEEPSRAGWCVYVLLVFPLVFFGSDTAELPASLSLSSVQ